MSHDTHIFPIFDSPEASICTSLEDQYSDLYSAIDNLNKGGRGFEFFDLQLTENEKESLSKVEPIKEASLSFESIARFKLDRPDDSKGAYRLTEAVRCENDCEDLKNIILDRAKIVSQALGFNDTKFDIPIQIKTDFWTSLDELDIHRDVYKQHSVVFNLIGGDTTIFYDDGVNSINGDISKLYSYESCVTKAFSIYDSTKMNSAKMAKCFYDDPNLFRAGKGQATIYNSGISEDPKADGGFHTIPAITNGPRLFVRMGFPR